MCIEVRVRAVLCVCECGGCVCVLHDVCLCVCGVCVCGHLRDVCLCVCMVCVCVVLM